jgi:hypothetical protein
MPSSIYKNLALVLFSMSLFFATLVMVVSIFKSNSNASKLVNIDTLEGRYYKIESEIEEMSDLKVVLKTAKTLRQLQSAEVQAVYIGQANNYDQFKVVNCNSVLNCNNSMVMKINKTNKTYTLNTNYALKAEISKDLKINIKEINNL